MPRGKPLHDAPGWRVIERQRRSWPAGYVIVPAALLLGLLQVLIPSSRDGIGWSQDQHPHASQAAPPSGAATAEAPRAGSQAAPDVRGTQAGAPPRGRAGAGTPEKTAPPPGPTAIQVSICHSSGVRNALRAVQVAAFLETRGFVVTDIRPVKDAIVRPSVRYFAARDLPETQRLVEILGAFFAKIPGRGPDHPIDFNESSPKPAHGKIEVWLPAVGGSDSQST